MRPAEASVFLTQHFDASPEHWFVNAGVGEDVTIAELAQLVARIVGYRGRIDWDPSMPDGTPRKLLDVSRINALGWRARRPLEAGLRETYDWYRHRATG